ncbi:hybrid sensor histidine kinase/response regulator [Alteromonadaceae bacterium M269]|nr:hybrid sensor histidine kinase/response regulator [Alteromonadaceae bacterium M269]
MHYFRIIRFVNYVLTLLLVLGFSNAKSKEPDLTFERFDAQNGLSQNTARALLQDSRGFIWIGTNDGLNRFDGYEFTVFRANPKDPNSLSSSHIFSLYEDSHGYIWIGTFAGLNRFDPETLQFTRYQHDPLDPHSISDNRVSAILEDKHNNLWVGTYWGGLNQFDPETGQFTRYRTANKDQELSYDNAIRHLTTDAKGDLWVTTSAGINTYIESSDSFQYFSHQPNNGESINRVYWDSHNILWMGTSGKGLSNYDPKTNEMRHFQHDPLNNKSIGNNYALSFAEDNAGNLWIGGDEQLNRYHRKGDYFSQYSHIKGDNNSLSKGDIVALITDKHGQPWFGSHRGGLSTLSPIVENFGLFKGYYEGNTYQAYGDIKAVIEDSKEQIWLGTVRGLIVFNQDMVEIARFKHDPKDPNSLSDSNIYALHEDKDGFIWVGTRRGGLNRYNPNSGEFTRFIHDPQNPNSISGNWVLSAYQDSQGVLWVGTFSNGLNRFNPDDGSFTHYKPDPNNPNSINHRRISAIFEDSFGELWITMHDGGVNKFNSDRTRLSSYSNNPKIPGSLSNDIVLSINQDEKGRIWIGTMGGGLNLYNRQSDDFTHFRAADGLSNDLIAGILSDDDGNLWLSTYNGISKFLPETSSHAHFGESDGVQRQFNLWGAYFKGHDGSLFFGGDGGLNRFQPRLIMQDKSIPDVTFTDFRLLNQSVPVLLKPDETNLSYHLNKAIYAQKQISLRHDQTLFSFEFSALHFNDRKRNQYAYMLEGWDKDWIYTDYTRRSATYTNIPPGNYTFKAKASNKDGVWNNQGTSIDIHISPPWYATSWAIALYCFTIIFSIWSVIYLRTRQARQVAKALALKVKERTAKVESLLKQKDTLFANISHEFRTPLTLILGPIEALLSNPYDPTAQKQLPIVKRSAVNLLHMVDQLLDLAHHEQLKERESKTIALTPIVRYMGASFESFAQQKNIDFMYHVDEEYGIQCSQDALEKILTNLLSNAFKYTPNGGRVCIELMPNGSNEVCIAISDSGIGIQLSDQKLIFERFTRAENATHSDIPGSGIGLALVDQLVEFYGGRIELESSLGKGSRFSVIFPISEEQPISRTQSFVLRDQDISESNAVESLETFTAPTVDLESDDTQPITLIIDDNKDMCHYIRDCLNSDYQCVLSNSPQQGFQIAHQIIPDIIISDVMMPKIDGIQLTHQLKENTVTSHIPVILLTAAMEQQDRIKGLEAHADDYMTKPFNAKELRLKIANQLRLRHAQQAWLKKNIITNNPTNEEKPVQLSVREQRFLDKLSDYIELHYTNNELSVAMISDSLGLTTRSLLRKVKALTGFTVNEYIRSYRLEKAKQLLAKGESVTEASLSVGFLSQHYFSRCFKVQYNVTPSEYGFKASKEKHPQLT